MKNKQNTEGKPGYLRRNWKYIGAGIIVLDILASLIFIAWNSGSLDRYMGN